MSIGELVRNNNRDFRKNLHRFGKESDQIYEKNEEADLIGYIKMKPSFASNQFFDPDQQSH